MRAALAVTLAAASSLACTPAGVAAKRAAPKPKAGPLSEAAPGPVGPVVQAQAFCPSYAPVPCGGQCCFMGDACVGGRCVVTRYSVKCPAGAPVLCGQSCYPAGTVCTPDNECGNCRYRADVCPSGTGTCTCAQLPGASGPPVDCGDGSCCPDGMRCGAGGCYEATSADCPGCRYAPTLCPAGAGVCQCAHRPGDPPGEPVTCPSPTGFSCCPAGMVCTNDGCAYGPAWQGPGSPNPAPPPDGGAPVKSCPPGAVTCGDTSAGYCIAGACPMGFFCGADGMCHLGDPGDADCCDPAAGETCSGGYCTRSPAPGACPAPQQRAATDVACCNTCCPPGSTCGPGGCGCGGAAPVGCGDGCCAAGATCVGGTCHACPAGHPVECGSSCCLDGAACGAGGACACPASAPVECNGGCCPAGMKCDARGCYACPKDHPAICGAQCCENAGECKTCPGESGPSCHSGACPASSGGPSCPGGWVGSEASCVGFSSGGCQCNGGPTNYCFTPQDFANAGLADPGSCKPEGQSGCLDDNGALAHPCCAGLTCVYGPGCNQSAVNGLCMRR